MPENDANSDEGADPSDDIKKQNPGATTTSDMTGDAKHSNKPAKDFNATKVQNLAKAGRDDFDPDEGQE